MLNHWRKCQIKRQSSGTIYSNECRLQVLPTLPIPCYFYPFVGGVNGWQGWGRVVALLYVKASLKFTVQSKLASI